MNISAMKQALEALEFAGDLIAPITENCQCQICLAHTALRQAIAEAEDAVAAEREACAQACEDLIGTRAMARHCADAIRARGEWVKSYCGGKPNYTTPFECPRCGHCCRVDWVGLTDEEIRKIEYSDDAVEYELFDEGEYGYEINIYPRKFARAVEAKLKEKNT